jgi:hypothetical protein
MNDFKFNFMSPDGSVMSIDANDIEGVGYTQDYKGMRCLEDATEDERGIVVKFSADNMVLTFKPGAVLTVITSPDSDFIHRMEEADVDEG